jgi:hypothetical protein
MMETKWYNNKQDKIIQTKNIQLIRENYELAELYYM